MTDWTVLVGDCVDRMRELPEASVDAVVTDPPYHLAFMGRTWDTAPSPAESQREHERWAREALRVLKPGGHLLAFGGTRTYHRLAAGIEDAGFEIRDTIANISAPQPTAPSDLLGEWIAWTERVPHAGLRLLGQGDDSVPAPVLLAPRLDASPASAVIAELASSEHRLTHAVEWRSALAPADEPSMASSALVTIAGNRPASPAPTSSTGSTAPNDALDWLDASTEHRTRAVEALRIWHGSKPSSRRAATDALCAALTDALKAITCAQSRTFQSYDTTSRTVCVSATTATTTASTAALLISFTADTLAQGGDALEVESSGPLLWIYGSGFPPSKSLDVSKAIDKAAGTEREVIGTKHGLPGYSLTDGAPGGVAMEGNVDGSLRNGEAECAVTAPATPEAQAWEGWGTALKPAHEPIVVARKPLQGTVAGNVLQHGTGALNVDGCRIGVEDDAYARNHSGDRGHAGTRDAGAPYAERGRSTSLTPGGGSASGLGRWPANVVLSHTEGCVPVGTRQARANGHHPAARGTGGLGTAGHSGQDGLTERHADGETVTAWECHESCPVRMLDEQTGTLTSGSRAAGEYGLIGGRGRYGEGGTKPMPEVNGDSGGASRFFATFPHTPEPEDLRRAFYVAKASSAERNAGLDGMDAKWAPTMGGGIGGKPHDKPCSCDKMAAWENEAPRAATPQESDTPPLRGITEPTSEDASDSSTTSSGSRPTDQSPRATRSTTETATSRTTTSPTSNSSPPSITSESTAPTTDATTPASGSDAAASAAPGSPRPVSTTTSAAKAGSSTADADPATSGSSSRASSSEPERCADCKGVIEGARVVAEKRNVHPLEPTVKPIELMRWLIRLVTPPGGTILDPFLGSGTTGCAAMLEPAVGRFIGIERDPEYVPIAEARIRWWSAHPEGVEFLERVQAEKERAAVAASGQDSLFDV